MKKFLAAVQAGIVLFAMSISGTGWTKDMATSAPVAVEHVDADAMTGAYFMRDTLVPRADDLALLQRKPALYLASFNDGMATVAYRVEEGRIVYRVIKGEIDASARDRIDRAVARLERKLA